MLWILIGICLSALIFLPKVTWNCFAVPQMYALGTLSSLGILAGVSNGHLPHSPPALFIFLFFCYMCLSALWTTPTHNAKKELSLQIPLIFTFFISSVFLDRESFKWCALATSLVVAFNSIYGYLQTLMIDPFFPNAIKAGGPKDNPIGSAGNPNFLASFFSSTLWLTVYAAYTIDPAIFVLSFLGIFTLYKTKSRAGQLGILGSVIFCLLVLAYYGQLPEHVANFAIDNQLFFNLGLALIIFSTIVILLLFKLNWGTFFHKEIDPRGEQVWYASFRYRVCYWMSALWLIAKRPLRGWGLWSFRREVYVAQASINEVHPWFLKPTRYITPQPRECHNDYLEYLVEFGLIGFSLFMLFIGSLYYYGFIFMSASIGTSDFFLMLILLSSLTSVLIDAFFFFALRSSTTAIYFWLTCGMIVSLSANKIFLFTPNWLILGGTALLLSCFFYECCHKRLMASYYFMRSQAGRSPQEKSNNLMRAITYSPDETLFRSIAAVACRGVDSMLANVHAQRMVEFFDGMSPLHAVLFNVALVKSSTENVFDEAILLLKNAHWALPSFAPVAQMLGAKGISYKGKYRGGGATMREVAKEVFWRVRSMIGEREKTMLEEQLLRTQLDNVRLRRESAFLATQNALLDEKRRLNIPNDWVYDADKGTFNDPQEMTEEQQRNILEGEGIINVKGEQKEQQG